MSVSALRPKQRAAEIRKFLEDRDHGLQFGDTCRDTHEGCEIALRTVYLISGGMDAKSAREKAIQEIRS